jgi:prepilin peptidase CpaA
MHVGYDFAAPVALFIALCAIIDYRTRRIPNWLTMPAAIAGLVYSSLAPHGVGFLWSLAGFAVGLSLLMLPWLLGGGGMGDVKMLAALGTWLGPLGILIAFAMGSVLAAFGMIGVLTFSMISEGFGSARRRYVAPTSRDGSAASGQGKRHRVLPFAVPIAISTWLVLAWMLAQTGG